MILNLRLDNVKLAMNKMFLVDNSSTLFGNDTTMKVRPGMLMKVRNVDSVKELEVSEVKSSAYTEIDSMFQMTQGLTGVSAPVLGMQQKVERTATGAEIIKNAADAQIKQPLRSISAEMGRAFQEILIMFRNYADK